MLGMKSPVGYVNSIIMMPIMKKKETLYNINIIKIRTWIMIKSGEVRPDKLYSP